MIIDKAKEVGILLAESEKFKRFKRAEMSYLQNEEAQNMVNEYSNKRLEFAKTINEKKLGPQEAQQYVDELGKDYEAMQHNDIIREYLDSKKEFDAFYQSVLDTIDYFVNGNQNGGCNQSSCAGCSGCH